MKDLLKHYKDLQLVYQLVIVHVSLVSFMFDNNLKFTSVAFFAAGFNLLNCDFETLCLKWSPLSILKLNICENQNLSDLLQQY